MKTPLLPFLLVLALAACSNEAAQDPASSAGANAPRAADHDVRMRLGVVFADGDPWMAGAVIDQGRIRVGDRLFLRTQDGRSVPVQITAIRDDATQSDVAEATAPQGVFLSFKPVDTRSLPKNLGNPQTLVTDPAQADETMVINSGSAAKDH